jgi:hypothetical protein
MSGNALGNAGREFDRNSASELLGFREISYVDRVDDHEEQARDRRHPDQEPRDVNGDMPPPRTRCPIYDSHLASSTPPMARFTRFRISGIL